MKLGEPSVVEIFGHAGFDFVILDREHGPLSFESIENLIRAADALGITPVVRVSGVSPVEIQRALDIGAMAVVVPRVESPEAAAQVVRAAKFAPDGDRGVCRFVRAADFSALERSSYFSSANAETAIVLQIEGPEGVSRFREIAEVPGSDVLFLGPYDLSQSMGFPGQVDHPAVQAEMKRLIILAKSLGKVVGTFVDTVEAARFWRELGVQFLAFSVDVGILFDASRRVLRDLRS
jgi:4-hydroxy-2-oxoheptanedioate aldolase